MRFVRVCIHAVDLSWRIESRNLTALMLLEVYLLWSFALCAQGHSSPDHQNGRWYSLLRSLSPLKLLNLYQDCKITWLRQMCPL